MKESVLLLSRVVQWGNFGESMFFKILMQRSTHAGKAFDVDIVQRDNDKMSTKIVAWSWAFSLEIRSQKTFWSWQSDLRIVHHFSCGIVVSLQTQYSGFWMYETLIWCKPIFNLFGEGYIICRSDKYTDRNTDRSTDWQTDKQKEIPTDQQIYRGWT